MAARAPARIVWGVGGVPPAEVAADDPIVETLLAAGGDLGQIRQLGGLDNWHDGATLTVEAGIPAVCFGPGDVHRAHTADEHVPIDDLVACAQRIALAAMRFCGVTRAAARSPTRGTDPAWSGSNPGA